MEIAADIYLSYGYSLKYGENEYKEKIRKMMAAKERRLIININHLRQYNREYAEG